MPAGVYVIRNEVNGKQYIGSAVDLTRRWREHLRRLEQGTHHNNPLLRAYRKYGATAFRFTPLLVCGVESVLFYEQRAIDALAPEYNTCRIAGSMLGVKRRPFTDEHKKKLSAARNTRPPEQRTPEQRARMSAAQKLAHATNPRGPRPPVSRETRNKIAMALKGNTNGKFTRGIAKPPVSDNTRAKLSVAVARAWANRKRDQDGDA